MINVIGDQFVQLEFDIDWINFGANGYDFSEGFDFWNYFVIPGIYQSAERVFIPHLDHPIFNVALEAYKRYQDTAEDFYELVLDKEEKDKWLDHLHSRSIFQHAPEEIKKIHRETGL